MECYLKTLITKKDCVMKINSEIAKNLARTADFINTVNGGSVYPTFETHKEKDQYKIQINMPSVDPDDLKVEISNSSLMVFQQMHVNGINLPNLIGMFKLSSDVVLEGIYAEYENYLLTVIMPINEMTGGFHRSIEIFKS